MDLTAQEIKLRKQDEALWGRDVCYCDDGGGVSHIHCPWGGPHLHQLTR
jgi:hypothetical protein